ncbi:MAG TPA: EAL domain-containing protein, partial [Gammaproteobacteria bacterium]|nr:EAL domain-containing protein [Gammaproteobacteria bacterium]
MKDRIHILLTSISLGVVTLLVLLVSIPVVQNGVHHRGMKNLIETTALKTAAITKMRTAVVQKTASLERMLQAGTAAQRNVYYRNYNEESASYSAAARRLTSLGTLGNEAASLGRLQRQAKFAEPYYESTTRLIMDTASASLVEAAMRDIAENQLILTGLLDNLAEIQQRRAERILAASRDQNHFIQMLLPGIALLALLLIVAGFIVAYRHLTEKNRLLAYHHSYDPLTGIINRREFESRLDRLIQQTRARTATHALLYIDLDQFKLVNDSCSHAAGDELLKQITLLLLGEIRQRDTLGRLGGDEFGLLLENCPLGKAVEIATRIQKAIECFQFTRGENTFSLGASIGVVQIDESTSGIASAMSAADAACYIAKESGRNRVQIAHLGDRRMQQRQGEMQWASRLRQALADDRFILYYQPIVPCAGGSNRERHIEILLRMVEEDGTLTRPGAFLPAAEKYNLAAQIDRWIISRIMEWQAQHTSATNPPPTITVNLSGQTLCSSEMLKFIIDQAKTTGVSTKHIIFEISETKAIANLPSATNFILPLRACGFRFSLDKFGSGLSTFTYLKKLPIDYLKIDGSF